MGRSLFGLKWKPLVIQDSKSRWKQGTRIFFNQTQDTHSITKSANCCSTQIDYPRLHKQNDLQNIFNNHADDEFVIEILKVYDNAWISFVESKSFFKKFFQSFFLQANNSPFRKIYSTSLNFLQRSIKEDYFGDAF